VAGKVRDSAIVNGLMVRAVGDCLIMSPPLCITKAEIDELIGLLTEAMDRVQTEVL
jgi:putrescine aminotransferase